MGFEKWWRGANYPNVSALLGFSICITGAMSNITVVADFVLGSKPGSGMPGRRGKRSDFDPQVGFGSANLGVSFLEISRRSICEGIHVSFLKWI